MAPMPVEDWAVKQDGQYGRSPKRHSVATPPRSVAAPPSPSAAGSAVKERPPAKARDNAVVLQLTRTKMCAFFERGKCASGNCRYAHAAEELRAPPNLQKTKLCRSFMQGFCAEGENCGFAHGESDLRVTEGIYKTQICNFYERGYCKKGDRCNHAHGASDLRPPAAPAAASTPQSNRRRAAAATLGSAEAQRHPRSPLPLAELLVDSEGNPKSVTELASLAFSPLPSSPLWGRFGAGVLSPAAALAGAAGELTPPWPRDPLDVLLEHRHGRRMATPLRPPPELPAAPLHPPPDPAAVDLTERLASLDVVVRELAADVQGLRGSDGQQRNVYSI